MTVSALLDIIFRINCHISFPLREMIDELPLFAKLLRPLGRVCDLLKANPRIEPGTLPAFAVARDAVELAAVLACCDTLDIVGGGSGGDSRAGGTEFAVLSRPLP